ncbi:MAG TPA: ABC transporter substrate-binding protein [Thermomicrobiales bacterium]|nr:ABC transporter substrate-binding protein [Thermomicrobiales bacterium]
MAPCDPSRLTRRSLVTAAAGGASAMALTGTAIAHDAHIHSGSPSSRTARLQDANLPTPREQTLVLEQGTNNVWDSFNPFIPNGEAYNYGYAIVCREYLFYANFLTGEITPWLGQEYTYNDDFTQCTLTLNPNARWNDGEPFTAHDIVFTQTLLRENPELNGAAVVIRDVAEVSATDDHTVVWNLPEPNPRFHYRFLAGIISDGVRIVPQHIWEGEDPGSFKFNPPVQTGPYVLEEASATKLYYLWRKNPDYWNKAELDPAPEYVMWRQQSEVDTSVQAFLAGNLDNSGNIDYLNQQVIESQYDQTARFDFPDPCTRGFWFNVESPSGLFATPEGRWALSHLIDREVIGTTIWQPASRPATYPWADYDGWAPWAPAEVMDQFDLTFNVDKANELLDALGATERDGDTRILNGQPLRLTMITPAETTGLEYQIGSSFANTAREAGIDIELKSLPGSAWGDAFNTGDYDISCHWICGMQFDPNQLYDDFHSRNYVPIGERAENDYESVRLQRPELDALIEELEYADPEDEANRPTFDQALEVFMTELPAVASIQTIYPMFFNTAYWTGWPSADDPYTIPANWWGQFMFVIGNLRPASEA